MADRDDEGSIEQYEELKKQLESGERPPQELFRQISQIAILISYDMVDKLRYWEKETLKLPDEEVGKRLEHHRDGTLAACTLASPAKLDGRQCQAGDVVRFDAAGRLLQCKVEASN